MLCGLVWFHVVSLMSRVSWNHPALTLPDVCCFVCLFDLSRVSFITPLFQLKVSVSMYVIYYNII